MGPCAAESRRAEQISQADVVRAQATGERLGPVERVQSDQRAGSGAGVDRIDDDRAARLGDVRQQQQAGGAALDQLDMVGVPVALA
jgi:hypothetical protein